MRLLVTSDGAEVATFEIPPRRQTIEGVANGLHAELAALDAAYTAKRRYPNALVAIIVTTSDHDHDRALGAIAVGLGH